MHGPRDVTSSVSASSTKFYTQRDGRRALFSSSAEVIGLSRYTKSSATESSIWRTTRSASATACTPRITWSRRPVVKLNNKHVTTLAEYLARSGLLTNYNKFNVKVHDSKAVQSVIAKFDEFETTPVLFVPIIYVMSDDNDIAFNDEKYERTTEYLQEFLSELAKPFEINDKSADFLNIPHLRTSMSVAPCGRFLFAFITPEMAIGLQSANICHQSCCRHEVLCQNKPTISKLSL